MRTASKIVSGSALLLALVCCSCATTAQEPIDSRQLNFQLLNAARAGDAAAVERLVRAGASVRTRNRFGATPLLEAARGGHTSVVRTLLAADADVNQANLEQATPLLETARNGHLETASVLVQSGADVNRLDLQLLSPLMHAVYGGHTPLVRLLIENGARLISSTVQGSPHSSTRQAPATWRFSRSFWIATSIQMRDSRTS